MIVDYLSVAIFAVMFGLTVVVITLKGLAWIDRNKRREELKNSPESLSERASELADIVSRVKSEVNDLRIDIRDRHQN